MKEMHPRYNPKDVEEVLYSRWEKEGLFHVDASESGKVFTIVIPPPNVTGILHMGHALNNTIQDILIRWRRMQGYVALWVPGTDHAGIATQNVVERSLRDRGVTRQELGRDKFVQEVWKWRERYGNTIVNQLKRLGASCDWSRTRFTMDKGLSEAVLEAFVRLYNKGLIYRGNYIINWCPRCQTALSDEEAPRVDSEGKLYYIKYPFKEMKGGGRKVEGIVVATTRPETMLGDVAVAVHPEDRRYKRFVGETLILPIVGREIVIVADDFVDKKFGTGAVKVTPAHDPDDFEISRRHNLQPVRVMAPDGRMNENCGRFTGMERFKAREEIVRELNEKGILLKIESHRHAVGHCYRCHTVIEPYLSLQWFVKMKPLARPAIEAVKKGKVKFHPSRWTKVYLNWMENIRDWCISRQIWWGHRLPVYYCRRCAGEVEKLRVKTSKFNAGRKGIVVSKKKPERCPDCGGTELYQDEDVLDTWFSSWLWPFSTLGWPVKTEDLARFYPTSVLVTAPEILFFWVARMIMAGMEFMRRIPFKDVYIHGTVRDLTGRKMSKSLGNIIDPIDIIEDFGADALRYSMIAITATGQDVFLSREKFEIGRNFANKIWNAARFVLMNTRKKPAELRPHKELSLVDRWILSRLNRTVELVTRALDNFRFNEAEGIVYSFFWHEFCDWYLEMVKPLITGPGSAQVAHICTREAIEAVLMHVLKTSLKLIHPFMPFVTDAVWENMVGKGRSIMVQPWPVCDRKAVNRKIERRMDVIRDVIVGVRNIRADMNVPHSEKVKVYVVPLKRDREVDVKEGAGYIRHLAQAEEVIIDAGIKKPGHCGAVVLEGVNIFVPLEGIIDIEAEKSRIVRRIEAVNRQYEFAERKLRNKNFLARAPERVVNIEREKREKLRSQLRRLKETLKDL